MSEPQTLQARIRALETLPDRVTRLWLLSSDGQWPLWMPGQYLEIGLDDDTWLPFSIASLAGGDTLELHIQLQPQSDNSQRLQEKLSIGETLTVRLPGGRCVLDGPDRPLTLIAGGTGFAQVKTMLEYCLKQGWQSRLDFYWGGQHPHSLYLLPLVAQWARQHDNLHIHPVVELGDEGWKGRLGRVTEALATDIDDARDLEVIASGSPAMVYAIEDFLLERGMPLGQMRSDVHDYAPREVTPRRQP